MNYIELLTKEEKSILCEIITGKDFKEFFKKTNKNFRKYEKGFQSQIIDRTTCIVNCHIQY